MAKPWEETWVWDDEMKQIVAPSGVDADGDTVSRVIVETDSGVYPPRDGERALIVEAPAMWRLLARLERRTEGGRLGETECAECMAPAYGREPIKHNPGCELDRIAKAIGYVP